MNLRLRKNQLQFPKAGGWFQFMICSRINYLLSEGLHWTNFVNTNLLVVYFANLETSLWKENQFITEATKHHRSKFGP